MCAEPLRRPPATPGRLLAHWLIRGYQVTMSPLMGRQCRYAPTCSHYTDEAIGRFGFWQGGWMGLARFLRCHPYGASGYDPVPETPDPRYRWYMPWRGARWTGRHIDPATRLDG
jgi:putative membrane protein insertion efficiency factor